MTIESGARENVVADISLLGATTKINKAELEVADDSKTISRQKGSVPINSGVTTVTWKTIYFI